MYKLIEKDQIPLRLHATEVMIYIYIFNHKKYILISKLGEMSSSNFVSQLKTYYCFQFL